MVFMMTNKIEFTFGCANLLASIAFGYLLVEQVDTRGKITLPHPRGAVPSRQVESRVQGAQPPARGEQAMRVERYTRLGGRTIAEFNWELGVLCSQHGGSYYTSVQYGELDHWLVIFRTHAGLSPHGNGFGYLLVRNDLGEVFCGRYGFASDMEAIAAADVLPTRWVNGRLVR